MFTLITNVTYVVVMLSLLLIIIANIELISCKNKSFYYIPIPVVSEIIQPEVLGTRHPVYIYNKNRIRESDLKFLPENIPEDYIKSAIPVHIANKLNEPIKQMAASLCNLPRTKMPFNTIYTGLNKSDDLLTSINPLNTTDKSKYRMLIHKVDVSNVELFMDDNIYFMK